MSIMKLATLCIIYSIAMSLGNWFCMSRKGETGGGGLVHPESENSMAMYGLAASVGPFLLATYNKCLRTTHCNLVCSLEQESHTAPFMLSIHSPDNVFMAW